MHAKQTVFRLTLPSNPKQIGRVEGFLKKIRRFTALDEIQFHKLMVSVTEAVNNAMIHGNKEDSEKKVRLTCEILPGWLLVVIGDEGKGFKPAAVRNPLSKQNLLRTSGRGVFLMRTLMDKVEFDIDRTGSRVCLWLNLNK